MNRRQQTGRENIKFRGFFNNMRTQGISLGEVLGSVFKANRKKSFFTRWFSCGSLRHSLLQGLKV